MKADYAVGSRLRMVNRKQTTRPNDVLHRKGRLMKASKLQDQLARGEVDWIAFDLKLSTVQLYFLYRASNPSSAV